MRYKRTVTTPPIGNKRISHGVNPLCSVTSDKRIENDEPTRPPKPPVSNPNAHNFKIYKSFLFSNVFARNKPEPCASGFAVKSENIVFSESPDRYNAGRNYFTVATDLDNIVKLAKKDGEEKYMQLVGYLMGIYDFNSLGAGIILGIKKPVLKSHGAANEASISNAIKMLLNMAQNKAFYERNL